MTAGLPERFNLRDLGGMPVSGGGQIRAGRLFRGASLHRLESEHRSVVTPLGLRLAIDLRTAEEVSHGKFAEAESVLHLPLFEVSPVFAEPVEDPTAALCGAYLEMLDQGRRSIRTIFELLADPASYPAVLYCAAGKDRTGVVCALILRQVGVAADAVVEDYVLSDGPADALRRWRSTLMPDRRDPVPAAIYRAPAAAIERFLAALDDAYGSVDAYLEAIDVPVAEIVPTLRENLVEKKSSLVLTISRESTKFGCRDRSDGNWRNVGAEWP